MADGLHKSHSSDFPTVDGFSRGFFMDFFFVQVIFLWIFTNSQNFKAIWPKLGSIPGLVGPIF